MAQFKLDQLHAENERSIQTIETQMSIDVELVSVESNLTVQRIEDETRMETEKIREQSVADGEVDVAKTKAEIDVLVAEGDLEVAKNVTKGEKGRLHVCHRLGLAAATSLSELLTQNNLTRVLPWLYCETRSNFQSRRHRCPFEQEIE